MRKIPVPIILGADKVSNYTGYKCPVCQKTFTDNDDVVVCPECGTPHHRACYLENGHCANIDGHIEGKHWSPSPEERPRQEPAVTVCGRCGANNTIDMPNCQVCGYPLTPAQHHEAYRSAYHNQPHQGPQQPYPPSYGQEGYRQQQPYSQGGPYYGAPQVNLTEEIAEGITAKEICDFVGPNNLSFLMKFKKMEQFGASITFNWCGIFGFFYCFYRKMYKLGAVYLGAFLAVMLPALVVASKYMAELAATTGSLTLGVPEVITPAYTNTVIASGFLWLVMIISAIINSLTFDRAYKKHAFKTIRHVKSNGRFSTGSPDYVFSLARMGGVNSFAILITIAGLFVGNNLFSFFLSQIFLK